MKGQSFRSKIGVGRQQQVVPPASFFCSIPPQSKLLPVQISSKLHEWLAVSTKYLCIACPTTVRDLNAPTNERLPMPAILSRVRLVPLRQLPLAYVQTWRCSTLAESAACCRLVVAAM